MMQVRALRIPVLLALVVGLLYACTPSQDGKEAASAPPSSNVPYAVTLDTLLLKDTTCLNSFFACTYVLIEVPNLGGSPAPPALAVNMMRGIALATNMVAYTNGPVPELPTLAKAFVDSFSRELAITRKIDPKGRLMPWFMEVRSVVTEARGLVFLAAETFTYTGGARPYSHHGYLAFNKRTGAPVALLDILKAPGALSTIQTLAEGRFRAQEHLGPKADYSTYLFENKAFALPANWRIANDSLEFVYNLYEIKPYADGFTHLRLPLSDLDSLLVPERRKL